MSRVLLALLIPLLAAWPSCNTPPAPTPIIPPSPPLSWDAGAPTPFVPVDPNVPPAPPPVPGDAYDNACTNERALGCKAGADPNCAASMRNADQGHITHVPVACLTSAKNLAALRACGFVKCTP